MPSPHSPPPRPPHRQLLQPRLANSVPGAGTRLFVYPLRASLPVPSPPCDWLETRVDPFFIIRWDMVSGRETPAAAWGVLACELVRTCLKRLKDPDAQTRPWQVWLRDTSAGLGAEGSRRVLGSVPCLGTCPGFGFKLHRFNVSLPAPLFLSLEVI
uniref:Uncharacterized protein n=1 Tax=Myotis myotis TaxID=51298 RepID=A0A7J7R0N3_MYOMY|nr:hypothetical protein mMyoMyo1_011229 [Myotis myotis]